MDFTVQPGRIYALSGDGRLLAEITFPTGPNGVARIDRTFVDDSLRGQGVAGALMEAAAAQIRREAKRAGAICSYAQAWFSQHPEQADLLV